MIDHMGIVADIGLIIAILTVLGLLPFLMARLERTMEQPVNPPSLQTGPRRQTDPHPQDLPRLRSGGSYRTSRRHACSYAIRPIQRSLRPVEPTSLRTTRGVSPLPKDHRSAR